MASTVSRKAASIVTFAKTVELLLNPNMRVLVTFLKVWRFHNIRSGVTSILRFKSVSAPRFASAADFYNGLAVVSESGKYGIIDKTRIFYD